MSVPAVVKRIYKYDEHDLLQLLHISFESSLLASSNFSYRTCGFSALQTRGSYFLSNSPLIHIVLKFY